MKKIWTKEGDLVKHFSEKCPPVYCASGALFLIVAAAGFVAPAPQREEITGGGTAARGERCQIARRGVLIREFGSGAVADFHRYERDPMTEKFNRTDEEDVDLRNNRQALWPQPPEAQTAPED